jgi:hypothetical protein
MHARRENRRVEHGVAGEGGGGGQLAGIRVLHLAGSGNQAARKPARMQPILLGVRYLG